MLRTNAVWGIDVGQCALKALKCRAHDDSDKIVIEAFDYIEYPKILTQPDAEPGALIADALKQFLSRNSVRGDRVAISLSGQSGLARFIKLPPVETKKIPDIVRYEARQQIPFDLNDVIWDYQRMGGGSEEEGFVLETEIGLFAIKRDVVFRALEPFQQAGIEVDVVQLTPLALYNYLLFDQLRDLPPPEQYDPEDPPESVAVISLGTDATDLVVTNGYRVWQRSVPLGGSHFTKALTKELKLTFAKAEHLKRNATSAQDPKAVFQAMRPVFNDLLTELDRSLHHFASIDRNAKITRVLGLGNAFKLPGLRRYLSQSLGQEIERIECFRGLTGPEVMATPAFKENMLSFGVCYGLSLQALNKAGLKTNLLPKEISRDRLIREKKPWAVAAAAVVLLGGAVSLTAYALALHTTDLQAWSAAEQQATSVGNRSKQVTEESEKAKGNFQRTKIIGDHLINNIEGRTRWLELLDVIGQILPKDTSPPPLANIVWNRDEIRERYSKWENLMITNIECQQVEDAAKWWAGVKQWYKGPAGSAAQAPAVGTTTAPLSAPQASTLAAADPGKGILAQVGPGPGEPGSQPAGGATGEASATSGEDPTGPAYIVQIAGYHYHNAGANSGPEYVRNTLIQKLTSAQITLHSGEKVAIKDLGISHPVLIDPQLSYKEEVPMPMVAGGGTAEAKPGAQATRETVGVDRADFRVQFVWRPTTPSQRQAAKQQNK